MISNEESGQLYCPPNFADRDVGGTLIEGQWREEEQLQSISSMRFNTYRNNAAQIRNALADYFMDVGAVSFQWNKY